MIDLYTSSTGNGRRAAIALEECGLPYRVHRLDLSKGDSKKADYLKINPAGAIPAIVDPQGPGGKPLTLAQSGAIVLYAAEKSGKLLPKDPARRAEAYHWFMQATTDVAPTSSTIFYVSSNVPNKDPANTGYFEKRFLDQLGVVDKQLQGREYLAGELSIADIALYPVIVARKAMVDAAPGLANLKAWAARMAARPSIAKALQNNG
jgi:GST-like protein